MSSSPPRREVFKRTCWFPLMEAKMPKRFRDLPDEEKASQSVAEDARDESLLYCPVCNRAMEQGDCIVVEEDIAPKIGCAYGDCMLNATIAMENVQPWDAYRAEHEEETAEWPEIPTPGECYRPSEHTPNP